MKFGAISKEFEALKNEKLNLGQELDKVKAVVDNKLSKVSNDVKKEVDDCIYIHTYIIIVYSGQMFIKKTAVWLYFSRTLITRWMMPLIKKSSKSPFS